MDEFRKAYQYEEEKVGGFLLVFFMMLLVGETTFGLVILAKIYNAVSYMPIVCSSLLAACIIYIISIIFTAISFYKLQRHSIKIAKVFLIVRLIFLSICNIIILVHNINHWRKSTDAAKLQFESYSDLVISGFVIPLTYILLFSISWYIYFSKSKKCKELIQRSL